MKKLLFLIVLYSLPVLVHSQVSWKKDDYLRDPRIAGDMEFRFWLMGVTPQTTGQTVEALLKRWPELKILPGDTLAPDVFNELVLEFSNPVSNNQITEWMDRFRQEAAVKFISPALKLGKNRDEGYSFLRNRIMLFLKQNIQLADVRPIFQAYGVTLLEELSLAPGRSFLVEVAKTSSYDALSIQNIWQNMPQFEIVCADFRSFTNFGNTTYQDPKRNDQRNVHNVKPTSSSNRQAEDMDVLRAWQISTGSTFHEVAILDDGLQFNHPDLSGNFSMGYDFYLGLSGNFPSIFNSSPSFYSRHGTGCAGVGFAKKNVLGGVGVAPNGRGVGYRIANKTKKQFDGVEKGWDLSIVGQYAAYFHAAFVHRASVLSNSYGNFGVDNDLILSIIRIPFDNIMSLIWSSGGKYGTGSMILFSSGNVGGDIEKIKRRNPTIAIVGATDPCGQIKHPTDCSGETWAASWTYDQNNPDDRGLTFSTPGYNVPSTDLTGAAGESPDDYSSFNGTSSSCPQAAAVANLVWGVDPALRADRVQHIMGLTADKSFPYNYTIPNPAQNIQWAPEIGFGRINAYCAVRLAEIYKSVGWGNAQVSFVNRYECRPLIDSNLVPGQTTTLFFKGIKAGFVGQSLTWRAELSDANGSFSNPTVIGTLVGNEHSRQMTITFPSNLIPGEGYRIRVRPVATNNLPAFWEDNGYNLRYRSKFMPVPVVLGDVGNTSSVLIATNPPTTSNYQAQIHLKVGGQWQLLGTRTGFGYIEFPISETLLPGNYEFRISAPGSTIQPLVQTVKFTPASFAFTGIPQPVEPGQICQGSQMKGFIKGYNGNGLSLFLSNNTGDFSSSPFTSLIIDSTKIISSQLTEVFFKLPENLMAGSQFRIMASVPLTNYTQRTPPVALPMTLGLCFPPYSLTMTNNAGAISDGSGVNQYPNNTILFRKIQPNVPVNSITLNFLEFETELGVDFLRVFSGTDTSASNLVASYSGSTLPSSLTVNSYAITLVFISNSTVRKQGFKINYLVNGPNCGLTSVDDNANLAGYIQDGSGGVNYAHNLSCSWVFKRSYATQLSINFTSFQLGSGDYLELRDGDSPNSPLITIYDANNLPSAPIIPSSKSLYLKFVTDGSQNAPGWELFYQFAITPPFQFTAEIASGTYCPGQSIPVNLQFSTKVKAAFTFIKIEMADAFGIFTQSTTLQQETPLATLIPSIPDSVEALTPVILPLTLPAINQSSATRAFRVTIAYKVVNSLGFALSSIVLPQAVIYNVTTQNQCPSCILNGTFTNQSSGSLTDGSDSTYADFTTCSYQIQAPPGQVIRINFTNMDLGNGDVLALYNGTNTQGQPLGLINTNQTPTFVSSSNEVFLLFVTDQSGVGDGWSLDYDFLPAWINTASISASTRCPGQNLVLDYVASGTFTPWNELRVELSDTSGSFSNPRILTTKVKTGAASNGQIRVDIPFDLIQDADYQVRVNASDTLLNLGASFPLRISAAPKARIIRPTFNVLPCVNQIQTLKAQKIPGAQYEWILNDSFPISQLDSVFVFYKGQYSLHVTDSAGCLSDVDVYQVPSCIAIHEVKERAPLGSIDTVKLGIPTGVFDPGLNTFRLELSSENGSFDNPVLLHSVQTSRVASMVFFWPGNLVEGDNYRLRLVSTHPSDTSEVWPIPVDLKYLGQSNKSCFSAFSLPINEPALLNQSFEYAVDSLGQRCTGTASPEKNTLFYSFRTNSSSNTILVEPESNLDVALELYELDCHQPLFNVGCYNQGGVGVAEEWRINSLGANQEYLLVVVNQNGCNTSFSNHFKASVNNRIVWDGNQWVGGLPGPTTSQNNLLIHAGTEAPIPSGSWVKDLELKEGASVLLVPNSEMSITGNILTEKASKLKGYGRIFFRGNTNHRVIGSPLRAQVSVFVAPSDTLQLNNLVLDEGASLLSGAETPLAGGITSGPLSVLRQGTVDPLQYQLWSSPVRHARLNMVEGPDYYRFHAGTQNWVALSALDSMELGRGYAVTGNANSYDTLNVGVSRFVGPVMEADCRIPITRNAGPDNDWNLVGNPYPSAVDGVQFLLENSSRINGAVYFWNKAFTTDTSINNTYSGSDYMARNLTSGSFSIGLAQGFFVEATADSLVFANAMRTDLGNGFIRQSNTMSRVWLGLLGKDGLRQSLLLGFSDQNSMDYEPLYDAKKFFGNQKLAFYSFLKDQAMEIQAQPTVQHERTIPLGMHSLTGGKFRLQLDSLENWPEQLRLYIWDAQKQQYSSLTKSGIEVEIQPGSQSNNRYHFVISKLSTELNNQEHPIQQHWNGNALVAHGIAVGNQVKEWAIFDLQGRKVRTLQQPETMEFMQWQPALPAGCWIAVLTTNQGVYHFRWVKP